MDFRPAIRDLLRLPARAAARRPDRLDASTGGRRSTCPSSPAAARGHPTDKKEPAPADRAARSCQHPGRDSRPGQAVATQLDRARSLRGCGCCRPSLPYADLDLGRTAGLRLPIGIAEADLRRSTIDFATEPHFLLFGDAECGKSSFLRALATSVTRRFTPEEARIILVDYRRSLMDLPESEHRIGYGMQAPKTHRADASRWPATWNAACPARTSPPQQLRDRSWWTGPELFVLVDDYDLVASGPANPLHAAAGVPAAGPRHRPAPGASPGAPVARAGRSTSRSSSGCGSCPRPAWSCRAQDEGALIGPVKPAAAAAGPWPAGHPARGGTAGAAGPPAAVLSAAQWSGQILCDGCTAGSRRYARFRAIHSKPARRQVADSE